MVKRVAAVLLALALTHLNAVRADAACASHDMADSTVASAPQDGDHHAHHEMPPAAPSSDSGECDAPLAQDCCASVASCGIAIDSAERDVADAVLAVERLARPTSLVTPTGADNAPEPPPPRA